MRSPRPRPATNALRRRGDGPALRVPGRDVRDRRWGRLRLHPGGAPVRGWEDRLLSGWRTRPAGRRRDPRARRRRGGARLTGHSGHRADCVRRRHKGRLRRGHPGDHPRARPARRRPQCFDRSMAPSSGSRSRRGGAERPTRGDVRS